MTTPKLKGAIDALRSAADDLDAVEPGAAPTEYTKPLQKLTKAIEQMKEAMKTERYTEEGQGAMAAAMIAQQNVIYKLLSSAKPD